MTAEVVIMNKNGVGLAADSAGTLNLGAYQKIYNSQNKLFRLSKNNHIGILTFSNSRINGVPFELLVKDFRSRQNFFTWKNTKECSQSFLEYLETDIMAELVEKDSYFNIVISSVLNRLVEKFNHIKNLENVKQDILVKIQANSSAGIPNQILLDKLKRINNDLTLMNLDNYLLQEYNEIQNLPNRDNIDDSFYNIIENEYGTVLLNQIKESISYKDEKELSQIKDICIFSLYKQIPNIPYMGIAIAGYGDDEYYPSCTRTNIYGIICNKVIHDSLVVNQITATNTAEIIPLAQSDNVLTFVLGISPDMKEELTKEISFFATKYILTTINTLAPGQAQILNTSTIIQNAQNGLQKTIGAVSQKNIQNILGALQHLSIPDIAQMAKNLVEITSLKKRISLEADTVGGPIDVAVISKGDGFIWIDRKHYFKKELNESFFEK